MVEFSEIKMADLRNEEDDTSLAHYGVLGMRWGIRRYQPYSVNPRKSGKGGKEIGDAKRLQTGPPSRTEARKSRKQRSAEQVKQKQREEAQEAKTVRQRSAQVEKAAKSGSATEVFNSRKSMSNKQLQEAINRIEMERKIKSLYLDENPTKMQKFKQYMKKANEFKTSVDQGIETWNTMAKVVNTMSGYEKMKVIGGKQIVKPQNKPVSVQVKKKDEKK